MKTTVSVEGSTVQDVVQDVVQHLGSKLDNIIINMV